MPQAATEVIPVMYTVETAAQVLNATPWAVRRLIYAGKLAYKRVGKRNLIPRIALEEFATKDLIIEGTARRR